MFLLLVYQGISPIGFKSVDLWYIYSETILIGVIMPKITNIKELGKIIRKVRKEQRLTQEQLATVCGVGIRFIRELEQGKESCHIGKALSVILLLGIEVKLEERSL